jgi:hypothetical protein
LQPDRFNGHSPSHRKKDIVTGRIIFIAIGLSLAATAVAAPKAKKAAPPPAGAPSAETQKLMQSCDAHKFETVVNDEVDGKPHQSKVKLCGKEGQSDSEWIDTLKDAVEKLNANKEMPASMREQISAALNAEIARLQLKSAQSFGTAPEADKSTALTGIAALPPLPQPKSSQAIALPPPRQTVPAAPKRDYAALPPLPDKSAAPVRVLPGGAASLAAVLPKPRMTLICNNPGQAEGPCTDFTRETTIIVRAGEDLPADTSLRFVRDGEPEADVELAQLKKGKSQHLSFPTDVCRHVAGGRLELRIVRSGQEVGRDGPYNLNC